MTPKIIVTRHFGMIATLEIIGHFTTKHCHYISGVHNLAYELLSEKCKNLSSLNHGKVILNSKNCYFSEKVVSAAYRLMQSYTQKFDLKCDIKEV